MDHKLKSKETGGHSHGRFSHSQPRHAKPRHAKQSASRSARGARNQAWAVAFVCAVVVLLSASLSLALTAGNSPAGSAATPSRSAPIAAAASGQICPLSGLPAPGGEVPQRPALAVKVDNYPDARPQSGLDKADVVFEEPVEGGITRLVAVFQCQDASLIGPIRSAREVDAQILDLLSMPIFVHVGGIAPVLSIISNANDYNEDISAQGGVAQNPSGRYAPYDTYVSTQGGYGLRSSDTGVPAPVFTYSPTAQSGNPVASLHIPFSGTNDVTWTWDASKRLWMLAYSGTSATVADGGQIGVPNVVVQSVEVSYGPWAENEEGGLEVQSQLTGSGPVTVYRNGTAVTGTWQRSSIDSPLRLVAGDGSTIPLAPGQTWVELVPDSVTVTSTPPPVAAASAPKSGKTVNP